MARIFFVYRDSPERRRALSAAVGAPERYRLYGLDELEARGHVVRHNLESAAPPAWARTAGDLAKRALERAGGYGGDFATVLGSLRRANRSDVVLSTVDTVGIPLMLLRRSRRLRAPLVYTAIGLPERLAQLRTDRMRRLYPRALASSSAVLAYSNREAEELRAYLSDLDEAPAVEFVPFGVDEQAFRPANAPASVDVVMAGADPHRDVELFRQLAAEMPSRSFHLVTSAERARALGSRPPNLQVEVDVPLEVVRSRLEGARVVALPVLENTYSGATTVLLQAMALGKAVVVTRTQAIATGYGLSDGDNCRLVEPGDSAGLGRAVAAVLRDEWHARSLGARARLTVENGLTWGRYVDRIESTLVAASGARPDARSPRG